jgi:diguanylate cyclase (GGDEF)-like protein/PAS domain S-box-containing protein
MTPTGPRAATSSMIRPYPLRRLVAATALLVVILVAGTCIMLFVSYKDTLRQEKTNLRNLAIAFAAQTFSAARAVDDAMLEAERSAIGTVAAPGVTALPQLSAKRMAQDDLLGLYVYDRDGKLVARGTPPGAGRSAVHPSAAELSAALGSEVGVLRISISDVDPATGRGVLNFSRATVDEDGRRTGTVLAQAASERFERIYSLVELGKGGSVTLFHRDGTMLVRGPRYRAGIGRSFFHTPLFQRHLPASERGVIDTVSPLDGQRRLYGYDAVSGYPLVIVTAINSADALAPWYGRVWTTLGSLVLILLMVMFLAWRVARDAARQSSLIGRLAASEARAEKSAEYLASILNSVGTPIWVLDGARKIVMLNDAFSRFVGRGAAELVGVAEHAALDPASFDERERRYRKVLEGAHSDETILEIADGSGAPRTVIQQSSKLQDASGQAQIVSVLTDITERQKTERRLTYIANFDLLTGLPNQGQFRRLLEAEVAGAAARDTCVGVLVVLLERVQEITDLMGHRASDSVLKQVGEVFQSLRPGAKVVARIKSVEFAVLVETGQGRDFLEHYAIELHQRLSRAFRLGGREFYLGPVIGVAMFPEDGADADELFRRADSALNRTGSDSGETIHFFSERAQTDLDERLMVESQLRHALERNEFRLLYQPKVQVDSGRIVGLEALLRWSNPVLGEVSPVRFIPIAERTGLIIEIGAWVLREACRQVANWNREGLQVKVAVNLSPRQFYQKDLLPMIRASVEQSGIGGASLELEITESALMSREQEVDRLMREIRALGIALSIDDFGTGYSSLAYLKRFPVQRLKVDRAFIRDLGKDEDSDAIVRSIVNLADGLKLDVVAEGVETAAQLDILRAMACDEYQGFLFSTPVDAASVLALFEQNRAEVV